MAVSGHFCRVAEGVSYRTLILTLRHPRLPGLLFHKNQPVTLTIRKRFCMLTWDLFFPTSCSEKDPMLT